VFFVPVQRNRERGRHAGTTHESSEHHEREDVREREPEL
jgi:hypothetical protein